MTSLRTPPRPGAGLQLRLAVRMARRLGRSGGWASTASTVFVAALFATAMFLVLTSLSLSGSQAADRDLGRFNASLTTGLAIPPGNDTPVGSVRASAREAGAKETAVLLSALDVQLDTTPARDVTLLEGEWRSHPFPDRYELTAGRWPRQPAEIVVTDTDDVPATPSTELTVLGDVTLRVVGTAEDRYARTSNLLAAPGTWAGLDPGLSQGYPALSAQPFLLWSGGSTQAVTAAVTDTLAKHVAHAGDTTSASGGAEPVVGRPSTRERMESTAADYWIRKAPAGYTVPAVLVPVGAVLLMFGLVDRRLRRTTDTMIALGLRPVTTVAAVTLAALSWCLIAATAGAAAGSGLGWALRPLLAHLQDRPPGDVAGLATAVLRLLATVTATAFLAGAGLLLARHRAAPPGAPASNSPGGPESLDGPAVGNDRSDRASRRLRDARHLLALAAWCAGAVFAVRVNTPAMGMVLTGILTAAILLVLPEIFSHIVRLLPERDPRRRLARRQLQADARRAQAALAVLTVLIGASLGFLALLDTMIRSTENAARPDVLPGQVLLSARASDTFPPTAATVDAVESSGVLQGLPRAEFRHLTEAEPEATGPAPTAMRSGSDNGVVAIDRAADAEILLGHPLTAAQTALLNSGGMLLWKDEGNVPGADGTDSGTTRLLVQHGERILDRTSSLPTLPVAVAPAYWHIGTDGLVLTATARDLDLPLPENGPIMFAGAGEGQAERVQRVLQSAGIDARTAHIHIAPEPPVPAAALFITAGALVLLTLVAVLTAVRGQTRALRGYLAGLVALGIPPSWGRQIILWQHTLLLGTSTVLGLVIALLPNAVVVAQISGFRLGIPWGQMALLMAAIVGAAALAATRSALTLRWRS